MRGRSGGNSQPSLLRADELLVGQPDTRAETGASTALLLDAGVDDGEFQVGNTPMDELIPVHSEEHKATDIPNPSARSDPGNSS